MCASLEGIQSPASGLRCCFLTLPPLSPHPLPFLISNCLYLPFPTLEKEMATHSSTLAWRIPWREEPGRLQSMGSQRVRHDRATFHFHFQSWASQVAQMVNCLPAMWETWVRSLGQEDPLEKEMATHSSTLAWEVPWMEEPGRLHSMGLQRVRQD